jgi:predicted unusual protein kinase regulating ubiquinone biosynthesis (AarF/ABC1/UbiB family)
VDLRLEAERTNEAKEALRRDSRILIAEAYPQRSTTDYAVYDYIEKVQPILDQKHLEPLRRKISSICIEAIFTLLFEFGIVHLDLQPGNLGLLPDGRLVIFDFGLCAAMDPITCRRFRDFFLGFVSGNARLCCDMILVTATHIPDQVNKAEFLKSMRKLVHKHHSKVAKDFQCMTFVSELFELQGAFGIVAGATFASAVISIVMLEGVIKRIYPNCDFQQQIRVLIPPIISRTAPRRPWNVYTLPWAYPLVDHERSITLKLQSELTKGNGKEEAVGHAGL